MAQLKLAFFDTVTNMPEFQRVSVRFKRFTEVYRGLQRVSESFREIQEV